MTDAQVEELREWMMMLAPTDATNEEREAVLQRLLDDIAYRCLFIWTVNRVNRLEERSYDCN